MSQAGGGNTIDIGAEIATALETARPPLLETAQTTDPPLHIRVAAVNQHSHLDNIVSVLCVSMGDRQSHYDPRTKHDHLFPGAPERWDRQLGVRSKAIIHQRFLWWGQ